MVTNPFTKKYIKGVFSNIPASMERRRQEYKEEKRLDFLESKQNQKYSLKSFNQAQIDEAREYQKQKAREVIDSDAPLSHKIKAINELHKEHRPKLNPVIQEISDRAYINRFNKDKRLERNEMLKRVLDEDKLRKQRERFNRMQEVSERKAMQDTKRKAEMFMRQTKMDLMGVK